MLYKMVDLKDDGALVQYVGVYVLKWRKEWGQPEFGFVEAEGAAQHAHEADADDSPPDRIARFPYRGEADADAV